MKKALKIEIYRAFSSKTFLLAILIGLVITVSQLVQVVVPVANQLKSFVVEKDYMCTPGYLFCRWIGGALMGI